MDQIFKKLLNIENTWGFKVASPSISQKNKLFENVLLISGRVTKLSYRLTSKNKPHI